MFVVSKTDTGLQRTNNEDCTFVKTISENEAFAVVCDGMGGAAGGQLASKMACDMISQKISLCYQNTMQMPSVTNMLLSAITTANVEIFDFAGQNPEYKGMGTTTVCAFVKNNEVCIGHVGDSRAYVISPNGIRQITKDHSLVQEMYDNGQISVEELKSHPVKNVITRALGVDEDVNIDFNSDYLNEGEAILLCSDGLTNYVEADEIYEAFNNLSKEELPAFLIDKANEHGGGDNITVALIYR